MSHDIHSSRIVNLNNKPCDARGSYVLYWIQASPRVVCNHALEFACARALHLNKPLIACFGLTQRSEFNRFANARHYMFLIQGLVDLCKSLEERGIPLLIGIGTPVQIVCALAGDCVQIIVDKGYLRIQRTWYAEVENASAVRVTQVETNVVVPVILVSDKEEYAAYSIRPKMWLHIPQLLNTPSAINLPKDIQETSSHIIESIKSHNKDIDWINLSLVDIDLVDAILEKLDVDRSVPPVIDFVGGETVALKKLDEFYETKLSKYDTDRNIPGVDCQSYMSAYLHFGHISPVTIVQKVNLMHGGKEHKDKYIEELVIRRELAMNMAWYNKDYDTFKCLPTWALKTLADHAFDKRDYIYSRQDLENAVTHDKYWNACQLEMVHKGKMHGYMRMYWAKKCIEWSRDCETAFNTLVYLNDKYEIDGRDPNGYCGIAWCFGKHDRPFAERNIMGKVRYMSESGLKSKYSSTLIVYVNECYEIGGRRVGDEKKHLQMKEIRKITNEYC